MTTPTLKLYYFDFDGGAGEAARLTFHIGGVPFEDYRFMREGWKEIKPTTPYGSVPVLEIDGQMVAQSTAITRYAGKLGGLYPTDDMQALLCDEVMDMIVEIDSRLSMTMFIKDEDEKKTAREELAADKLPVVFKGLERRLEGNGGEWFADKRLTVADLRVFVILRRLMNGVLDHIPADIVSQISPPLAAHFERVNAHPSVVAYYAMREAAKSDA
ncbi:MAG: glutathione S-transferase [Bradymonadia bacterium]|jgi:glutathione S-transferase